MLKRGYSVTLKILCLKKIITHRGQETFSTPMHFSVKWGPFFLQTWFFCKLFFFANLGMWPQCKFCVLSALCFCESVFHSPWKPGPGFYFLVWPLATQHRAGIVLSWAGHGGCFCMILSIKYWAQNQWKYYYVRQFYLLSDWGRTAFSTATA